MSGWQGATELDRPTPFLTVDLDTLRANLAGMARRIEDRGGLATPHLKTHKTLEIARMQRELGAVRATVATLAEADLALRAGFDQVLIAYPPVPRWRAEAIRELAARCRVAVTCTSPEQVAALRGGDTEVYWEIDSGTRRLGTAPGQATAAAIGSARFGEGTRLAGLMTFAGHAYTATDPDGLRAIRDQQDAALVQTAAALGEVGAALRQSVGVTPLARYDLGVGREYRYGNYVFNDMTQVALGGAALADCALAVVSTVVDVPDPHRVVLDAGAKALPAERMTTLTPGFGAVIDHAELSIDKLFEEHGLCSSSEPHRLRTGDRVVVVPNHACTAANLHGQYAVLHDGAILDSWQVRARRG